MVNIMIQDLSLHQNLGSRLEETLEKLETEFARILTEGFAEDNNFYLHLGDIRSIARKLQR